VLFQPLALVGDGQARTLAVDGVRDGPGDRALVGDPEDESELAFQEHPATSETTQYIIRPLSSFRVIAAKAPAGDGSGPQGDKATTAGREIASRCVCRRGCLQCLHAI